MNIERMGVLAAIEWYDGTKIDLDDLKTLVEAGITDTEVIERISGSDVELTELVSIPDLDPTEENLRLLETVGAEIMTNDPENAEDWAKLIDDFNIGEDVELFRRADRSPGFARKVMELFERHNLYSSDLGAYDITLPYADIASRVESGLTAETLQAWNELEVDLAAAQAYENDGLSVWRAQALVARGIDRPNWFKYKDLPGSWIGGSAPGQYFTDKPPKDWATIDELLDLYQRGYTDTDSVPWTAKLDPKAWNSGMKFTLHQAQMLADAGMKTTQIAKMWNAGGTSWRRTVDNSPPHILPPLTSANDSLSDEMITTLIELHKLGIRPSHLTDYRWAGAHSLDLILQAVAAGISPARAKELRENFGWKPHRGYRTATPKRIHDIIALFAIHSSAE